MVSLLLIGLQILQYCSAGYVAHIYWPRTIIGYYHIPVMQKMRYVLPAPEEVGHHLPAAVPVEAPTHHAMTAPEIIDAPPTAVEPAGTVIAQQPYSMIGYHMPAMTAVGVSSAVSTPMMIAAPSGGVATGYQGATINDANFIHPEAMKTAAIFGDKQYNTENSKNRVPKMAITPQNSPQSEAVNINDGSDKDSQNSYIAEPIAPEGNLYQEKPVTTAGSNHPVESKEATASEMAISPTGEDHASKSGYRLHRIVLQ